MPATAFSFRNAGGLLLVTASLLAAPEAVRARTVILHPLEGSITNEGGGPVLGFCDAAGARSIDVRLNGKPIQVPVWDGIFTVDLDWVPGKNVVDVGGRAVSFTYDPYADEPNRPVLHQAMVDDCASCHVVDQTLDLRLRDQPKRLCMRCHPAGRSGVEHGDASCADCHSPHASTRPHLVRDGGNGLCSSCHRGQSGNQMANAHGSIGSGPACSDCHRPHKPTPDAQAACERCHGEHESGTSSHRDAACSTCHWMHRDSVEALYKEPKGSCDACHRLSPSVQHAGVVGRCTQCHEVHKPTIGSPFTPALCAECHAMRAADRHGSAMGVMSECATCHPIHDPRDLSQAAAACVACHETQELEERHVRPVTGRSDCLACHRLHGNDARGLLVRVQHEPFLNRRCSVCHDDEDPQALAARPSWADLCLTCHGSLSGTLTHAPARLGQCGACHDAHGGDVAGQLRRPPDDLCRSCHDGKAGGSNPLHPSTVTCLSCHDPHGGGRQNDLRAEEADLCGACHRPDAGAPGDSPGERAHQGSPSKKCSICHDSHASEEGPAPGARPARARTGGRR